MEARGAPRLFSYSSKLGSHKLLLDTFHLSPKSTLKRSETFASGLVTASQIEIKRGQSTGLNEELIV